MRRCTRCASWKEDSEFNIRDLKRGLFQYVCRDCQQQQMRDRYASKRQNVLKINRQSTQKLQIRAATFIQEYLSYERCADCGESDMVDCVVCFNCHMRREQTRRGYGRFGRFGV